MLFIAQFALNALRATVWLLFGCVCLLRTPESATAQRSPIKLDEQVTFFPTVGGQSAGDNTEWTLPIHGWIYELEADSVRRTAVISALCQSLSLLEASCDSAIFRHRAQYFLADNEGGKSIPIVLGEQSTRSSESGSEGHFRAEMRLSVPQLQRLRNGAGQWIPFRAPSRPGDPRVFEGQVLALEPHGISIISDIDDTVKESAVGDREELLKNTFLRPYRAVPGMAELYRSWATDGVSFHYLSASPWQLYVPLAEFFKLERFPQGSFHMKEFRWKDSRFFDLFIAPDAYKAPILETLISRFPKRRFVLVGDSGERDPEVYGAIARRFPTQDIRIVIREFGGALSAARLDSAFVGVKLDRWRIVGDGTIQSDAGRESLREFVVSP